MMAIESIGRGMMIGVVASALTVGCATKPELAPTRVESEWVQPQIEEAARRAAQCLHGDVERMVEIEASREGRVRGWVLPFRGATEEQACVDREALSLRVQPSTGATRALMTGGNQPVDPTAPRARSLSLRARVMEQVSPVTACAKAFQTRQMASTGRVAIALEVGRAGEVERAAVALSTADGEAARCVSRAAQSLELPPIPGAYRFSYWLAPRGVVVGAADVSPVDPSELSEALAVIEPKFDRCMAHYSVAGDVTMAFTVGEEGAVTTARIDRSTAKRGYEEDDAHSDACAIAALKTLRLPPFDGGPKELVVPYKLR